MPRRSIEKDLALILSHRQYRKEAKAIRFVIRKIAALIRKETSHNNKSK